VGDRKKESTFDTESADGLDGKSEPLLRDLATKSHVFWTSSQYHLCWDRLKEGSKSWARIVFDKDLGCRGLGTRASFLMMEYRDIVDPTYLSLPLCVSTSFDSYQWPAR
jgi:hypothetical protein